MSRKDKSAQAAAGDFLAINEFLDSLPHSEVIGVSASTTKNPQILLAEQQEVAGLTAEVIKGLKLDPDSDE